MLRGLQWGKKLQPSPEEKAWVRSFQSKAGSEWGYAAVVLAGGQGTRMESDTPQVLHEVAGMPLVCHVVRVAATAGRSPIVVVASADRLSDIKKALAPHLGFAKCVFAAQDKPLGPCDATAAGLRAIANFSGDVLILPGNMPLLTPGTLLKLAALGQQRYAKHLQPATALAGPDGGAAGVYWAVAGWLHAVLMASSPAICSGWGAAAAESRGFLDHVCVSQPRLEAAKGDTLSVCSRVELAEAEAALRQRLVQQHMEAGVTFRDPGSAVLGPEVQIGRDCVIGVGVQLVGRTFLGARCRVDGPTVLVNTVVGDNCHVKAFTHLEEARMEAQSAAGPFARLRPQAVLESGAFVGNFVEVKNSTVGRNTNVCHLSYLGDSSIGDGVNVGAGTVTCNFDGVGKNRTVIGNGVFVGSGSTLIAPVEIGSGAMTAAGSVITEDVPSETLAFGRARQVNKEGRAGATRAKIFDFHRTESA